MKETGIVRCIDDLGRIELPKELLATLRVRAGGPLAFAEFMSFSW